MKKFFAIALLLLLVALPIAPMKQSLSNAESNEVVITVDYTYLYKNPDKSQHYDFKILSGEKLAWQEEINGFYYVSYSFEETNYSGYVWKEHTSPYATSQEVILQYNATIIAEDTLVFPLEGVDPMEGIKLAAGTRIYLYEGFNAKKDFLPARFVYNGETITARIAISAIKPDGVNKALIISITAIIAIVGVVLILLGLKKNKWHKRLKKLKK